jgi:hypothetical protein
LSEFPLLECCFFLFFFFSEKFTTTLNRFLAAMFELSDFQTNPRSAILLDLYFYTLSFARLNGFSNEKTSTLFSIIKAVHSQAICIIPLPHFHFLSLFPTPKLTEYLPFVCFFFLLSATPFFKIEEHFDFFKKLLVKHSVERPPFSVEIFSLDDVKTIIDYVANTYFRHYKLYLYAFTKKPVVNLSVRELVVQVAPDIPPLIEGKHEANYTLEEFAQMLNQPLVPSPPEPAAPTGEPTTSESTPPIIAQEQTQNNKEEPTQPDQKVKKKREANKLCAVSKVQNRKKNKQNRLRPWIQFLVR